MNTWDYMIPTLLPPLPPKKTPFISHTEITVRRNVEFTFSERNLNS